MYQAEDDPDIKAGTEKRIRTSNEMNWRSRFSLLVTLLLTATCVAQSGAAAVNIRMLPGYLNEAGQGIDSQVGAILRKGGLKIAYDIGAMAGDYTNCKLCGWTKDELWRKEQVINGRKAVIVFTKSRRMVISFPEEHANFYATITSQVEMADMLLMVLTYTP